MIHLEGKYYLQPASFGWILVADSGRNKQGEQQYKSLGYYTTIQQAIRAYIDKHISERISFGIFELEEAITIIKEENQRFESLLLKSIGNNR